MQLSQENQMFQLKSCPISLVCVHTGAATEREGGGRHHWCLCSQRTPRICGECKFGPLPSSVVVHRNGGTCV